MQMNDDDVRSTIHYSRDFSLHDVLLFLNSLEKSFDISVTKLYGILQHKLTSFSASGRENAFRKLQPEAKSMAEKYFSLCFTFCRSDPIIDIRITSHELVDDTVYFLIQVSFFENKNNKNIIERIGEILSSLKQNLSGYAFIDVSDRFASAYATGSVGHRSEFPESKTDYYTYFSEELFWYRRLARPIELMIKHGLFRNVYPYNFLCEEQIFTLKLLFESEQFPILSAGTEDRLKRRSKLYIGVQKPKLPGELIPLGGNAALWCVPNNERKPAFDVLKRANATLYRFFIDHTELFPPKYIGKN